MVTIHKPDYVDDFLTNASGYPLYKALKGATSKHDLTYLSFTNISANSSSFLNSSLAALVDDLGIAMLN